MPGKAAHTRREVPWKPFTTSDMSFASCGIGPSLALTSATYSTVNRGRRISAELLTRPWDSQNRSSAWFPSWAVHNASGNRRSSSGQSKASTTAMLSSYRLRLAVLVKDVMRMGRNCVVLIAYQSDQSANDPWPTHRDLVATL